MHLFNMLEPSRWAPRKNETPLQYWLSFSPAAPVFGVEWRFSDDVGTPKIATAPRTVAKSAKAPARKEPKAITPAMVAKTPAPKAQSDASAKVTEVPEASAKKATTVTKAKPAKAAPKPAAATKATPEKATAKPQVAAKVPALAKVEAATKPVVTAKAEAPKAVAPKSDEPKTVAPKTAAPKTAAPKAVAPKSAASPVTAEPSPSKVPQAKVSPVKPSAASHAVAKPAVVKPAPTTVASPKSDPAPKASAGSSDVARPENLLAKAPTKPDDLKRIKGVGPKLERELNEMGIYSFAQISKFSEGNLAWVDSQLTSFKGRPIRDNWVAQSLSLMG